ncbi:hypothetical protein ABZ478_31560 [Streptomyces sp. NPDC005706]|uniref:hypothetical protein n=1 Tax=Streptomyces sp. NPDC005706 TaxID=3157169 RepID=UPI00340F0D29
MRRQDVHDELRARLHEAAEAHEPDRARILARVERGTAAQSGPDHRAGRAPVFGWLKVVTATAGVAGVLAVGGYAVASAVKEEPPVRRTVAVSPAPPAARTPSPDATGRPPAHSAGPGTGATHATPGPDATPSRTPEASVPPPVARSERQGPLWSDGSVDPHSNDFWAQSDVTLKTSKQLTSLKVELKVAQTGGVASTGAWRSLPEADFGQTVEEHDGFLVYTWTLKDGRTVPAGTWVFAGQYDHERGGRDAKDDSYTITGTAGGRYAVAGTFAAHDDSGDDS